MEKGLKNVSEQSRQLWDGLSRGRRTILGCVVSLMAIGLGWMIFGGTGPEHAILFSGLSGEDAGEAIRHLDAQKIPYRLEAGGGVITVPADQVHKLRIQMAGEGVPRGGGVGFELFEKQAFGTTSFVEKMNYRRALQGELQRTIESLAVVHKARVHIAMQDRSLYKDEDNPPTASVVVQLHPGREMSRGQVKGIVNLVSSSIEGLSPERVTVVDSSGTVLASGDADHPDGSMGQMELERTLSKRVSSLLEKFLGPGHVAVSVTAELDTARTERTEELYDPEKIVVRSEQRTVEGSGALESSSQGVVGARANIPGSQPGAETTETRGDVSRLSETRNYEVNRIVSRTVGPEVRIRRLHVAVLVDGVKAGTAAPTAEGAAAAATDPPAEDATVAGSFVPRNKEELARIEAVAREAAGLDPERGDRIEVHSVPFAPPTETDMGEDTPAARGWALSREHITLIAGGAGALFLAIVALMLLRGGRGGSIRGELVHTLPARVSDIEASLTGGSSGGGAGHAPGLPEMSSTRDRALGMIRSDAKRAARLLASWVTEAMPDAKGGGR